MLATYQYHRWLAATTLAQVQNTSLMEKVLLDSDGLESGMLKSECLRSHQRCPVSSLRGLGQVT